MIDIFLHQYNQSVESSITAANIAHKYRMAIRNEDDFADDMLRIWDVGKAKILNNLINQVNSKFETNRSFAFAVAPSNTRIFVDDIESAFSSHFTNSINLSNCFSKINGFNAGKINKKLSINELRNLIDLDAPCFNSKIDDNIKTIVLLDDVYAWGNTFEAMKIAMNDVKPNLNYFSAVILKTSI